MNCLFSFSVACESNGYITVTQLRTLLQDIENVVVVIVIVVVVVLVVVVVIE